MESWGDWLGTGTIASFNREFLPFSEAREFVHSFGFKNIEEWEKWHKSGQKPDYIPTHPARVYEKEWKGMGYWLGTGYVASQNREFLPFSKAKEYVRSLGLKTWDEYRRWCKSGKKPADIPTNPNSSYENEWIGWGDWLGTGTIANQKRKYRPFSNAKQYVQTLGLKSNDEWREYCKTGKKPSDIPTNPDKVYENEWIGWGDWLGYEIDMWIPRRVKELL
ncbi:MAG: integrase repeat-containing protein [Nitrososphaeraceae archaeon]